MCLDYSKKKKKKKIKRPYYLIRCQLIINSWSHWLEIEKISITYQNESIWLT